MIDDIITLHTPRVRISRAAVVQDKEIKKRIRLVNTTVDEALFNSLIGKKEITVISVFTLHPQRWKSLFFKDFAIVLSFSISQSVKTLHTTRSTNLHICFTHLKDKRKKYEPPVPTRVGKKQKKLKGPEAANKLPQGN